MNSKDRCLYEQWEKIMISALDYNDIPSMLAIKTIKICTVDCVIDHIEDEYAIQIAANPYALLDYTIYLSFFFRMKLLLEFPEELVKKYYGYTSGMICTCYDHVYNIPQNKIKRIMNHRVYQYEQLTKTANEKSVQETINFLVQCIENDLNGDPESDVITVINIFEQYEKFNKITTYFKLTYELLQQYEHQLLSEGEQISLFDIMNDQESSSSQDNKPKLSAKGSVRLSQKVEEATIKENHERRRKVQAPQKHNKSKFPVKNIKDWIFEKLGVVGVILYFGVLLFLGIFPFVMIDVNFIVELILMPINMFFPVTSIVFWIWGLVCTINGPQDIFAIIYYVSFAVLWVPSFIWRAVVFVSSIFSRK